MGVYELARCRYWGFKYKPGLQAKKKRSGERFYMTYEKSDLEVYTIAECEHIVVDIFNSLVSQLDTSVAT